MLKDVIETTTMMFRYCLNTASVRCLATMAIAQGLCTNLLEYAWKIHLQMYCPTSSSFTAFLGDVASLTGIVTVGMMLLAPTAFKVLGWRKTARATPTLLLFAGAPFFVACAVFQAMARFNLGSAFTKPLLLALSVRSALTG
jgi:ATP:ADP antiporter, AAA family